MYKYLPTLFTKLFNRRPLTPPDHHKWTYAHIPPALEWSLKARNYNTTVANAICAIMTISAAILFYETWIFVGGDFFWAIVSILFFSIVMYAVLGTTHQTVNFAFRFSTFGLELCEWKGISQSTQIFIKIFTILLIIVLLIMLSISPETFIVSLGGIGGLGIFYLVTINSQAFRDKHTKYYLEEFPWKNFKEIHVDRRKKLISLKVTCLNTDTQEHRDWPVYLFAPKKDFERNLAFIKTQLPRLPVRKMRISVLKL